MLVPLLDGLFWPQRLSWRPILVPMPFPFSKIWSPWLVRQQPYHWHYYCQPYFGESIWRFPYLLPRLGAKMKVGEVSHWPTFPLSSWWPQPLDLSTQYEKIGPIMDHPFHVIKNDYNFVGCMFRIKSYFTISSIKMKDSGFVKIHDLLLYFFSSADLMQALIARSSAATLVLDSSRDWW